MSETMDRITTRLYMIKNDLSDRLNGWWSGLNTAQRVGVGVGAAAASLVAVVGAGYALSPELRDYINDSVRTAYFNITATPDQKAFVDMVAKMAQDPETWGSAKMVPQMDQICAEHGPDAINDLIRQVGDFAARGNVGHFSDYVSASKGYYPDPLASQPETQRGLIEALRGRIVHMFNSLSQAYNATTTLKGPVICNPSYGINTGNLVPPYSGIQ